MRPDEHLLTGDTAGKVKAAAVAKYPTATVERVETDSDGVYEAHLQLADGSQLIVQVGKSFAITGTETMGTLPAAPALAALARPVPRLQRRARPASRWQAGLAPFRGAGPFCCQTDR